MTPIKIELVLNLKVGIEINSMKRFSLKIKILQQKRNYIKHSKKYMTIITR